MAGRDEATGCIGCLGLLFVLFVIGSILSFFSGEEEEANSPSTETTTEESVQRERTQKSVQRERTQKSPAREVTKSEPRTPEERIRANLESAAGVGRELKNIWIYPDETNGCTRVRVDYRATVPASVQFQMEQAYRAVYRDEQIGGQACDVEVNAYGETSDDFGQISEELFYSTHMTGSQAARVNWSENARVNFPNVWTLNYKHPTVEQAEAQAELERAIDCAVDEGLFDNWLCPS